MSSEVMLPALPFGGDEVTVVRWLRQPGDVVAQGDALLVAANERAEVALPASAGGALAELLVHEGAAMRVGAAVARFAAAQPAAPALRATPLARRIAAERGLDLAALDGSGPGGRVMKRDVLGPDERAAAAAPISLAAPAAAEPPAPAQPIPRPAAPAPDVQRATPPAGLALDPLSTHILTAVEVDLGAAETMLARQGSRRGAADLLACVAQVAVAALMRFPLLNATWHDDGILARRRVHLGVRHARNGQTAALTIPDAQDLNLRGLARALAGQARPDQPQATFTIVAGDSWGAQPAPPAGHSALLYLGAVAARPAVVGAGASERISVRPIALLALAFDARILDQPQADAYLAAVRRNLEQIV